MKKETKQTLEQEIEQLQIERDNDIIIDLILSRGEFPQQLIDSKVSKDAPHYHEWLHNLKKIEENIYIDFSRNFNSLTSEEEKEAFKSRYGI